jgi:heme-degrading monooxygenase HmoA
MPDPTHATLATFHMDPTRRDAQLDGLHRMIVPGVRSSPGFVAGTWTLDPATNESVVVVTWESEADAESFVASVEANAPHQATVGIELRTISVVEVAVTA